MLFIRELFIFFLVRTSEMAAVHERIHAVCAGNNFRSVIVQQTLRRELTEKGVLAYADSSGIEVTQLSTVALEYPWCEQFCHGVEMSYAQIILGKTPLHFATEYDLALAKRVLDGREVSEQLKNDQMFRNDLHSAVIHLWTNILATEEYFRDIILSELGLSSLHHTPRQTVSIDTDIIVPINQSIEKKVRDLYQTNVPEVWNIETHLGCELPSAWGGGIEVYRTTAEEIMMSTYSAIDYYWS